MTLDLSRPAVALCMSGTRAEFERRIDDARSLYREAWDIASDPYERCVAAHYVAHLEPEPSEQLRWHRVALEQAEQADPTLVAPFYGSLYVNLGRSYELTGDAAQAHCYYELAEARGVVHRPHGPA